MIIARNEENLTKTIIHLMKENENYTSENK